MTSCAIRRETATKSSGNVRPIVAAAGLEGAGDLRGLEADQGDRLDVGAVRVARLQAHLAELVGQVGDGLLLARRARPPALELVGGKDLDVLEDLARSDAFQGRFEAGSGAAPMTIPARIAIPDNLRACRRIGSSG